jgi:hypothetical protein
MTKKHNCLQGILSLLLAVGVLLCVGCVNHPEEEIPDEDLIPSENLDQSLVGTWVGGSGSSGGYTSDASGKLIVKIFPSGTGTLTHGNEGTSPEVAGTYTSSGTSLTFTPVTGTAETFSWEIKDVSGTNWLYLTTGSTTYSVSYRGAPSSTGNPNA